MRSFVFCLCLALTVCFSTAGRAEIPEAQHAVKELTENAKLYRLQNGLRIIFYRRPIAPVFSAVVGVRVGGVDETLGVTGISHLLEHMAFKGTPDIGTRNFSRERELLERLESLAAIAPLYSELSEDQKQEWDQIHQELSKFWVTDGFSREYDMRGAVNLNATTGKELTKYTVSLPRTAFEFWCRNESERILHPVMRQFYQERDVVMEERRMRYENDPLGKLYELLLSASFQAHPYRNPVIGYSFDIQRLTAAQVLEFQRRYYVPRNIVIALVGDVHPEKDLLLVERYFGRLPDRPLPPRKAAIEPQQQGERTVNLATKASPSLIVAYKKPAYPHLDDPPISLMGEMLAGGSTSPLYEEMVKEKRIASSVSYDEGPGSAYPNLMFFSLTARSPHSNEELLAEFDTQIESFKQGKVDTKLLKIAKRAYVLSYLNQLRDNLSIADSFVSSELIYDDFAMVLKWFQDLTEVTPSDISRVAGDYLRTEGRTIAAVEAIN